MADSEEDSKEKKTRLRSPSYPSDGLETCFKWARKIYDEEGKNSTSTLVAVKHMGYSSLSGAARTGISAMKKFGLLTEDGSEKVRVSEDAVRLMLNPDEGQRTALLQVLAKKPEIIRELLSEHSDKLPSDESLKYKLVTDRAFNQDAANTFLKSFRETLRFAKLAPGQSTGQPREASMEHESPPPAAVTGQSPPGSLPPPPPAAPEPEPAVGALLHVWSLGGGVTVHLRSNVPLTPRHFRRLAKYVGLAAEAEEEDDDAVGERHQQEASRQKDPTSL